MEGEVGRFRRRHLVPVPAFDSLDALNAHIAAAMATDDDRRIGRRRETVGEAFAAEAPLLAPLPDTPFDCARLLEAKVDAKARICVIQSFYSVPVRLARRRVTVRLGARHLEVLDPVGGAVIARHPRSLHKGIRGKRLRLTLLNIPARVVRTARRLCLRLPAAYQHAAVSSPRSNASARYPRSPDTPA